MQDGQTLWRILQDVDETYFSGPLPAAESSSRESGPGRLQNCKSCVDWEQAQKTANLASVKHVERLVTTYIREECNQLPTLTKKMDINLKAIAFDGAQSELTKLALVLFLASLYSESSNARTTDIIGTMDHKQGTAFMEAIQATEALDDRYTEYGMNQDTSSEADHSTDAELTPQRPSINRDPSLAHEEQLFRVNRENRELGERVSRLESERKRLQTQCDEYEEQLIESRLQLDQKGTVAQGEDYEKLKDQTLQDAAYIAELESKHQIATTKLESLERQLERLKADDASKQDLRDELQLLRTEKQELEQRTKRDENLKKKIQALQDQEKVYQAKLQEMESQKETLSEIDSLKDTVAALHKSAEEHVKTIANSEQEIFDRKSRQQTLEHEVRVLSQRLEQSKDQSNRYQEMIQEYETRIQDLEASQATTPGLDLERELAHSPSTDKGPQTPKTPAVGSVSMAEFVAVQQELALVKAKASQKERIEKEWLDTKQENLGLQDTIKERKLQEVETSQPFLQQRDKLQEAEVALAELRTNSNAMIAEIAQLKHNVAQATAHPDSSKLEPATEADHAALIANHEDLLARLTKLESYSRDMTTKLEDKDRLLQFSLLNEASLSRLPEDYRRAREFDLIVEQLRQVKMASEEESGKITDSTAMSLTHKIESGREKIAKVSNSRLAYDRYTAFDSSSTLIETPATTIPNPPQAHINNLDRLRGPPIEASTRSLKPLRSAMDKRRSWVGASVHHLPLTVPHRRPLNVSLCCTKLTRLFFSTSKPLLL